MNQKQTIFAAVIAMVLLVGVVSAGMAQAQGRGQGQGKSCQGEGVCQIEFNGPMDDPAMIRGKLAAAIEDEYHAKAVYADVIASFGEVRPFSNIINAEQRHVEILARLYEKYGIEAMADPYKKGTFEVAGLKEAAQASLDAEIANAGLYDELLEGVNDPDVIAVITQLQWASRERHVPAIQNFLDNGGQGGQGGQGNGNGRRFRGGR